jgi:hypothetical protein
MTVSMARPAQIATRRSSRWFLASAEIGERLSAARQRKNGFLTSRRHALTSLRTPKSRRA